MGELMETEPVKIRDDGTYVPPLEAYKAACRGQLARAAEIAAPVFQRHRWEWGGHGRPVIIPTAIDIYESLNRSLALAHERLEGDPERRDAAVCTGRFEVRIWAGDVADNPPGASVVLELGEVDLERIEWP